MANNLKYTLLVLDKFTAPIQKAAKSISKLNSGVQGFSNKASKVIDKTCQAFTSLNKKIVKTGKSLFLNLSAPLGLVGYKAIKGAGQFERYERVLTTMLGSVELARERLSELERIAIVTPFELHQVVELGNQLQALDKYSESNVMMLGDLAAASGKPIEQVSRAFAKLVSGQKGLAVDMFRDLLITTDDWVEATGKGMRKSGELMATTDEMLAVLPEILRRKNFIGMMEEQSKGLEGVISNMQDATSKSFRQMGKAFADSIELKKKIQAFTQTIDNLTERFNALSPEMKKIISYIALFAFVAAPALIVIGKIGLGFMFLAKGVGFAIGIVPKLIGLFKILFAVISAHPLIAIGVVFAALLIKMTGGFEEFVEDIKVLSQYLAGIITGIFGSIADFINGFVDDLKTVTNFVADKVSKLAFWKNKESIGADDTLSIQKSIENRGMMQGSIDVNFANAPAGTNMSSSMSTNTNMNLGTNMSYAGGI